MEKPPIYLENQVSEKQAQFIADLDAIYQQLAKHTEDNKQLIANAKMFLAQFK